MWKIIIIMSFVLSPFLLINSVQAWWNSSWEYRVPIDVINQINYSIETYKLAIYFDTQSLISAEKMQSDCDDIRLTYYNTMTNEEKEVPYYLESGCNTNTTKIWSTIPYLPPSSNTTMYFYYGNPSATMGSDEKKTCPGNVSIADGYCWEIYDDFSDNSLDSRWEYSYIRPEAFSNIREGSCPSGGTGCWIVDVLGSGTGSGDMIEIFLRMPSALSKYNSVYFKQRLYIEDNGYPETPRIYLRFNNFSINETDNSMNLTNSSGYIYEKTEWDGGSQDMSINKRYINGTIVRLSEQNNVDGDFWNTKEGWVFGNNLTYKQLEGEGGTINLTTTDEEFFDAGEFIFAINDYQPEIRTWYIDYIQMRTYVDPEPLYSIGLEESIISLKLPFLSIPSNILINQTFPVNLSVYFNTTPLTNLTQQNFQLFIDNKNLSITNFTTYLNGSYSLLTTIPYNILGTYPLKVKITYQNQSTENSTQIFISTPIKQKILFITTTDWQNILSLAPLKKPTIISSQIDSSISHFINTYSPEQIFLLGTSGNIPNFEVYTISSNQDTPKLFFNTTQGIYAEGQTNSTIAALLASLLNRPIVFNSSQADPNYNFENLTREQIEEIYLEKVKENNKNINYIVLTRYNFAPLASLIASKHNGFVSISYASTSDGVKDKISEVVNKLNKKGFFINNTEYLLNGSYLLILGNIPHVILEDPVEKSWGLNDPLDGDSFLTDLEYGDLNNDTYLDVAVGRLPSDNKIASLMFARTFLPDNKTALVASEYLHRNWFTILLYAGGGMWQGRTISKTLEDQNYQVTRLVEHRADPLEFLASLTPNSVNDFLDQAKQISETLAELLGSTLGAVVYKVLIALKALQFAENGLEMYLEYNWSTFGPKLSNAKEYIQIVIEDIGEGQNLTQEHAAQLIYILWPYPWKELNNINLIEELQQKSIVYYEGIGNGSIWILPNAEPHDTGFLGWREFLNNNQYNGSVNLTSDEIPNITTKIIWDNSDLAVNGSLYKSFLEKGSTSFIGASAVNYAPFSSEIDSRFFKHGFTVGNSLMNAINDFRDDWLTWDPLNVLKKGIKAKTLREFILYGDPSLHKDPIIEKSNYLTSVTCNQTCELNLSIPVSYSLLQTQNETTIVVDTDSYLLNLSSPIIPLKTFEYFLPFNTSIISNFTSTTNKTFYNITLPKLDLLSHSLTNLTSNVTYDVYPENTYRLTVNNSIDNRTRIKFVHTAIIYNESNKTAVVFETINLTLRYFSPIEFSISADDVTKGENVAIKTTVWSNITTNASLYFKISNQSTSEIINQNITITGGKNTFTLIYTPTKIGNYLVEAFLVADDIKLGPRQTVFTVKEKEIKLPAKQTDGPSQNETLVSNETLKIELKEKVFSAKEIREKIIYPICGNNICEANETSESCPEDCMELEEQVGERTMPTGKIVLPSHFNLISLVIVGIFLIYLIKKTYR